MKAVGKTLTLDELCSVVGVRPYPVLHAPIVVEIGDGEHLWVDRADAVLGCLVLLTDHECPDAAHNLLWELHTEKLTKAEMLEKISAYLEPCTPKEEETNG